MTAEIIIQAFGLAMFVQSVNACFWEGNIFGYAGAWLEHNLPFVGKPIALCTICMTPYYGMLICLIFGWNWMVIPVAMGINTVIARWEPKD